LKFEEGTVYVTRTAKHNAVESLIYVNSKPLKKKKKRKGRLFYGRHYIYYERKQFAALKFARCVPHVLFQPFETCRLLYVLYVPTGKCNIHKFCVVPTQCVHVRCMELGTIKTANARIT